MRIPLLNGTIPHRIAYIDSKRTWIVTPASVSWSLERPWTAWHWNVIAAWELDLPTQGRYACMSRHQNLAHRKMQWRSCQVQLPVPRCKLIFQFQEWLRHSISMFLKHVPSLPQFGIPAPGPVISRRLTHPMPRGNIAALRPNTSVQHGQHGEAVESCRFGSQALSISPRFTTNAPGLGCTFSQVPSGNWTSKASGVSSCQIRASTMQVGDSPDPWFEIVN